MQWLHLVRCRLLNMAERCPACVVGGCMMVGHAADSAPVIADAAWRWWRRRFVAREAQDTGVCCESVVGGDGVESVYVSAPVVSGCVQDIRLASWHRNGAPPCIHAVRLCWPCRLVHVLPPSIAPLTTPSALGTQRTGVRSRSVELRGRL